MLPRQGTSPKADPPSWKAHHLSEYKCINSRDTHIQICVVSKTFCVKQKRQFCSHNRSKWMYKYIYI